MMGRELRHNLVIRHPQVKKLGILVHRPRHFSLAVAWLNPP
jgi:hypothetical protein